MDSKAFNSKLFELKNNLLFSTRPDSIDLNFEFSCCYHGINLHIKTNSQKLVETLKNDLPESWQTRPTNDSYMIHLVDPRQLNIELEEWVDEASQDCFYLENGDIAIQRDFASRQLSELSVLLISEADLTDGLYNFLRWFLPRKLLAKQSYIMHSSCIIGNNNKAYIFLGHSGAGKTTISGFSKGRKILGDDMNLMRLEDGKLFAQAGAIGGFFKSEVDYDQSFEVNGFYWLEQSDTNKLVELSKATSLSKLMASYANLFWESLDEKVTKNLFELSVSMIHNYPMNQLCFKKDDSFWELLDES